MKTLAFAVVVGALCGCAGNQYAKGYHDGMRDFANYAMTVTDDGLTQEQRKDLLEGMLEVTQGLNIQGPKDAWLFGLREKK